MKPDIVVDVGNTAIKWGRCANGEVGQTERLPAHESASWQAQADRWELQSGISWAVAGVNPAIRDEFAAWIRNRGDTVRTLIEPGELPLVVHLERPDQVGIDRLLDAVAANQCRPKNRPAVVVDAGTAVTVDWIDGNGAFAGGAILPGMRLMAQALHEHTALLPMIEIPQSVPPAPAKSTRAALQLGVFWSVAGGIQATIDAYRRHADAMPIIFLTGGDAPALHAALKAPVELWPSMTLEGIRIAAEALP